MSTDTIPIPRELARTALFVLEQATSFTSKKARDKHPNTVVALRSALTQQAEPAKCRPEGIPCGMCDVGTYSELAMATPLADALRALPANERKPPKCKSADRPCIGAADFIADLATPPSPSAAQPSGEVLTEEERRAIVDNYRLNVGDWTHNGLSVARDTERATLAKIGAGR